MKFITSSTANDIKNAMRMAAIVSAYDFFPNLSQTDPTQTERIVENAFSNYCSIEGITVIDEEPDYPEVRIFFDDTEDDCDYEIGFDPYSGMFTDDV